MANYDKKVLDCFLENQLQLFPEKVAETPEEADDFLEMMFAVVVKGKRIMQASEVFDIGDGRYLIVEG